jgi:hypothetical protein
MAYRQTVKRITAPKLNPIQAPSTATVQKIIAPAVKSLKPYNEYTSKETETFLSNYNDPTELNSFIDALTNREAVSKKFGDTWGTVSTASGTIAVLSFAGSIIAAALAPFTGGASLAVAAPLAKVGAIASIPAIPAAIDVTVEKGIKPIIAGKPKEALLNTLMNLGETMDAVANPVKGLILEGPEGFAKGTGLADGGRVNYDYDTGSFVADMFLEIISDPMNWVDFGLSSGFTTGAKKVGVTFAKNTADILEEVSTTALKESAQVFTKEELQIFQKHLSKKMTRITKDWNTQSIKNLSKEALEKVVGNGKDAIQQAVLDALHKARPGMSGRDISVLFNLMQDANTHKKLLMGTAKNINELTLDSLTNTTLKNIASAIELSSSSQKALTKAALATSGYGAGVFLAKKGFPHVAKWASEHIISKLTKAGVMDRVVGIDIKKYAKAKALWDNEYKYITSLTGEVIPRTMDSFYYQMGIQLNRELNLLEEIIYKKFPLQPNQQIAAIESIYTQMHKCSFTDYIEYLKKANTSEHGLYKEFITRMQTLKNNMYNDALLKQTPVKLKKGKQLAQATGDAIKDTVKILKTQDEIVQQLETQTSKTALDFSQDIYTIKQTNDEVAGMLANNEELGLAADAVIDETQGLGAYIKNILDNPDAYADNTNAQIMESLRVIRTSLKSVNNTRRFFNELAKIPFDNIQGISSKEMVSVIINEIYGSKRSIVDLLATFDSITMNDLAEGIENSFRYTEQNFKFKDHPELLSRIKEAYSYFLQMQDKAGVEDIKNTISKEYTEAVKTIQRSGIIPEEILLPVSNTVPAVYLLLTPVSADNWSKNIRYIFNAKTIFDIAPMSELSNAGLGIRAMARAKNIAYFNIPEYIGYGIEQLDRLGKKLNDLIDKINRYDVDVSNDMLKSFYNEIYYTMMRNPKLNLPDISFKYLKYSEDTKVRYAQLVEFFKAIKDNTPLYEWYNNKVEEILKPYLQKPFLSKAEAHKLSELRRLLYRVRHPEYYFVTDFAWDPMHQADWVHKAQFSNDLINGINMYRGLASAPETVTNSFYKLSKEIGKAQTQVDSTKLLALERFFKEITPFNTFLKEFEQYYDGLFDHKMSEEIINDLYNIFQKYPELYKQYHEAIVELDKLWKGDLTFKQSAKGDVIRYYKRAEELKRTLKTPAEVAEALKREFPDGIEDEFKIFWERMKNLNRTYVELQRQQYTEELIYSFIGRFAKDKEGSLKLTANLKRLFSTSPEYKDKILNLFNDHNQKFTQENYELYRSFMLKLGLDDTTEIPDELIPNMFKDDLFRVIQKKTGVEDINVIYNIIKEAPSAAGGYKHSTKTLEFSLFRNNSYYKTVDTLNHEMAHAMTKYLSAEELTELYDYIQQGLQRSLGNEVYNRFQKHLINIYAKHYNYSPGVYTNLIEIKNVNPEVYNALCNELVSFTRGFRSQIKPKEGLPVDTIKKLMLFNEELSEKLDRIVVPAPTPMEYKKITNPFLKDIKTFTPWSPVAKQQELHKALNKATDLNTQKKLNNILQQTPEQFTQDLATRHRILFVFDSMLEDTNVRKKFDGLRKSLNKDLVGYAYNKEIGAHIFALNKTQLVNASGHQVYLNSKPILKVRTGLDFSEFQSVDKIIDVKANLKVTDTLNKLQDTVEKLTGTNLGDSQGECFSEQLMRNLYDYIPEDLRKILPSLDDANDSQRLLAQEYFDVYPFSESVFGRISDKVGLGMYSGNMITNMKNTLTQTMSYSKNKTEYVHTMFDSMFSINSPNSIFKNYTDAQLLDALQNTREYKLVTLIEDKKYGYKVKELYPTSVDVIKKARELGAVVVPLQVFKDMYNKINHRIGSTGFAKLWSRVMYAFKFGYLARPGAMIRNAIDTNLKTLFELKGDMHEYKVRAHQILNEYDKIKDFIHKRQKYNESKGIQETLTNMYEEYFKTMPTKFLNLEQFKALNNSYFSTGVAENIMGELYDSSNGGLWEAFTHVTGKVVDLGNQTERYNRLATYLWELDQGLDNTAALARVAKIHFDYSFKNTTEQLIDMIFPFTTFSLRNYSYWIEMLEKQPWLMRQYVHLMKPHWDFKDYTPEELARDYRVQTQILYGQLKLAEFNNKVITFKANPSIQDAIQMFSDPINNVYEKLAAPISIPLKEIQGEHTQPNNLIPVLGPALQSLQTMYKTKTPLPSAIGVSPTPKRTGVKFSNGNYKGINEYRDNNYRTPKYRNNVVYDGYRTRGVRQYRMNFYPIVDIAHEIRMRYNVNVSARIKNRIKTDVYNQIRYRIRTDSNIFR